MSNFGPPKQTNAPLYSQEFIYFIPLNGSLMQHPMLQITKTM